MFKKWADPGLFLLFFVVLNSNVKVILYTSAGIELASLEYKARMVNIRPPPLPATELVFLFMIGH